MATKDGEDAGTVGCGGALLMPFSSIAVGARLLVMPDQGKRRKLSPYRALARTDDRARPLTTGSMRVVGAMLLFWTLVLPATVAVRAVMVYGASPAVLVVSAGLAWVAMFVGQVIGAKIFQVLEPRLPHDDS